MNLLGQLENLLLASTVHQPVVLVAAVDATTMMVEARIDVGMVMTIDIVSTVMMVVLAVSTAVISAALVVKKRMGTMMVQVDGRVVLSAMPDLSEVQALKMGQVRSGHSLCYACPDFVDLHFVF